MSTEGGRWSTPKLKFGIFGISFCSTLSTCFSLSLCPLWAMFYYLSVEPNLNCIFGGEQLVAKKKLSVDSEHQLRLLE